MPGWLQTIEFSRRPYDFVRQCSAHFGDTYTLNIAGMGNTVMFSSPEAVRAIFALPGDGMHNGNDVVRYLLNERSVVFLEGKSGGIMRIHFQHAHDLRVGLLQIPPAVSFAGKRKPG